jgi:hypothetical protein
MGAAEFLIALLLGGVAGGLLGLAVVYYEGSR